MYYEVNVSTDSGHLFATAKRSITTKIQMKKLVSIFKIKFPAKSGYSLMVTKYEETEEGVNIDSIK